MAATEISADVEAKKLSGHPASSSQTVQAPPGLPDDGKAVTELVPIGQPGGLHARERQREMTARQRLERERRERAKERQEAAKAAAMEAERAGANAIHAAEEEAAAATAAVPSIELGTPGGLHAKIEAEKAIEALLPSAAESRARLKR